MWSMLYDELAWIVFGLPMWILGKARVGAIYKHHPPLFHDYAKVIEVAPNDCFEEIFVTYQECTEEGVLLNPHSSRGMSLRDFLLEHRVYRAQK